MARVSITLRGDKDRDRACVWAMRAPAGTRIDFVPPRRSLAQNDLMWAALRDVARHVEWYGSYLSPEDWKIVLTASLRKARVVPGVDPGTVVPLGLSTSRMTKRELSDLIELIFAFGAEHGVEWSDEAGRWNDAAQAPDADPAAGSI